MVGLTERYLFLCVIFIVWICQCESAGDNPNKKQLEEIEEANEDQREKELNKIYSAAKANSFLTYEKCVQRLKCPASRKEECSEECKAGNTEEEMEEHEEITHDEHRSSLNKSPKQKYETTNLPHQSKKAKSNKNKQTTNPAAKVDL